MAQRKKLVKVPVPKGVDAQEFERAMNEIAPRALEIANELRTKSQAVQEPPKREPWDPANNPRRDQDEYFEKSKFINRLR